MDGKITGTVIAAVDVTWDTIVSNVGAEGTSLPAHVSNARGLTRGVRVTDSSSPLDPRVSESSSRKLARRREQAGTLVIAVVWVLSSTSLSL